MVLTSKQKDQLIKDILEYLVKNQYQETAQIFADQISISLADVDPEGGRLEIKWKSILTLQKKIAALEEENESLKKDLTSLPSKKQNGNGSSQQLYILKKPAKFELKGHKSNITSVAFHPQYTQMATSSQDATIKLWQFQTGDYQNTLKGHTNPVNFVTYDQQVKYLFSCSSDLTIKLWDLNNNYQCFKTFFDTITMYRKQHSIQKGDALFSCSRDKTINLWQISTGFCRRTYTGHQNWVRRIVLSQDGKTIVSGSDDQSVIVWERQQISSCNEIFLPTTTSFKLCT